MRSLVGVIFLYLGYLAKKIRLFDSKIVLFVSIFSIFAFVNHDVDINNLVFHNEFLYIIFAFLGTVLVVSIARYLSEKRFLKSFLGVFGKDSLFVMLTHTIFLIIQSALFFIVFTLFFSVVFSAMCNIYKHTSSIYFDKDKV